MTRQEILVGGLLVLLSAILVFARLSEFFAQQVDYPILFRLKEQLNPTKLDPRIKIFAIDDQTVAKLNKFDLSLTEWGGIFQTLAQRRPAAIFLDKLFDRPDYQQKELQQLANVLADLQTYVVVIGFTHNSALQNRKPLAKEEMPPLKLPPQWYKLNGKLEPQFAYGPHPALTSKFAGVGHAMYQGDGYVRTFVPTHSGPLAHWSLLGPNFPGKDTLLESLPIDRSGRTLVNMVARSDLRQQTSSFLPLFAQMHFGKPADFVNEGDFVVILPAMYTGNTDWRETPLGPMQGGFVMTAMLNANLKNEWLRRPLSANATVIVGLLLPLLFFRFAHGRFLIVLGAICLAWVMLALTLFVAAGIYVPIALPGMAFALSSAVIFREKVAALHLEAVRMERELNTAKLVQESYLFPPQAKCLDIAVHSFPASECRGDWWGHTIDARGREWVFMADATGHGLGAALVTAMTYTAFKFVEYLLQNSADSFDPAEVCRRLDQIFRQDGNYAATMTIFVACFDPETNEVSFSNAGHPFPMHFAASRHETDFSGKPFSHLRAVGNPVGTVEGSTYQLRRKNVTPGDLFLFYTDGLLENPVMLDKRLRMHRLKTDLAKSRITDAESLVNEVVRYYEERMNGKAGADDVTVLAVKFKN